jgi:hypothetical protein
MQGNLHVQFLGGQARATAPGYPATLDLTCAADGSNPTSRIWIVPADTRGVLMV